MLINWKCDNCEHSFKKEASVIDPICPVCGKSQMPNGGFIKPLAKTIATGRVMSAYRWDGKKYVKIAIEDLWPETPGGD